MESLLDPYFYAYNPELLAFENAWLNFMKSGIINRSVIKTEVADSWRRCREMGIDPTFAGKLPIKPAEEVKRRLALNADLLKIVAPYMESLYDIVKGSGFVISFIDADGYILKIIGDEETLNICVKTGSLPGANRLESHAGTTSIGLAIITGKPIQIAGAEHYLHELHRWTCSSAPILDQNKNVKAVLNVAGRYEMIHQHTLGMVSSVAKAIENEVYIQKINEQLSINNSRLKATIEMVSEGVVYTINNMIIQANKRMCELIGKSYDDVIGQSIFEKINTGPELKEFINNKSKPCENEKIILYGNGQKYNCFLDVQPVYGENVQNIGTVLIFKRIDEIKVLASKIEHQAKYQFSDIIGNSPACKQAMDLALKAAQNNVRVIIEGESGTGKEMFAQAIHNQSNRSEGPFIAIDCGALPSELLESELFGYERGAFTGAKKEGKPGVFELAHTGTLFFDEIGNMPVEMQQKLLRVLQENVVTRIGGSKQIPVDVRVIAATNARLEDKVLDGSFRSDLYYRLNVVYIKTPVLRECRDDIPVIIESFLSKNMVGTKGKKIDKKALDILTSYDWPGNVRQLHNVIEYGKMMCKKDVILAQDLPLELLQGHSIQIVAKDERQVDLKQAIEDYIKYIVQINGNNICKAARILDISRSTVYKYLGDNFQEIRDE